MIKYISRLTVWKYTTLLASGNGWHQNLVWSKFSHLFTKYHQNLSASCR